MSLTCPSAVLVAATALASLPGAAIAYALPPRGPIVFPVRWWCGSPAPIRTRVAMGATTAVSAGVIAATHGRVVTAAAFSATAVVYVILAVADVRRRRLPHRLTVIAWIAAMLAVVTEAAARGSVDPIVEAAATTVAVCAIMLGIAFALPGQLGLGDVNLASAITFSLAWSSWTTAIAALVTGMILQVAASLGMSLLGTQRDAMLPMGPALVIGWFVALTST